MITDAVYILLVQFICSSSCIHELSNVFVF